MLWLLCAEVRGLACFCHVRQYNDTCTCSMRGCAGLCTYRGRHDVRYTLGSDLNWPVVLFALRL